MPTIYLSIIYLVPVSALFSRDCTCYLIRTELSIELPDAQRVDTAEQVSRALCQADNPVSHWNWCVSIRHSTCSALFIRIKHSALNNNECC